MKIFLDTANIEEIKKYLDWGVVNGVTTNPTWIANEGVDLKSRTLEIADLVDGPISGEVCATDFDGMLQEARDIASWHENMVVKLPITPTGLAVLDVVSKEGIKTNMTLCFSLSQALLVAKAGATFVSPFIGRLTESGGDGVGLVRDMVNAFREYDYKTQVLSASFRSKEQIEDCIRYGSHVVTIKPKFLEQMMQHDLTDVGLEKFNESCRLIAKLTKSKK